MSAPESDPAVLEMYKITVEMTDRISSRRGTANTMYISLQTAVLAVLGFLTSGDRNPHKYVMVALAGAGAALALAWWMQLRSYRDLSKAKFAVIEEIEKQLPIAPYTDEWKTLKKDRVEGWRTRYAELGVVERVTPWVFVCINAALAFYLWTS